MTTAFNCCWDVLASVDFTTNEVWTKGRLVTFYLLFVIELTTRRVHFAGCTPNPHDLWMLQVARNLSDADDGFLRGKKYLLMYRDTKFSDSFRWILEQAGVQAVQLPPRSPDLSPHIERFMSTVKDECLHRIVFFGEMALRNAVRIHYHEERNHQGIDNRLIEPGDEVNCTTDDISAASDSAACCGTTTVARPEFTRYSALILTCLTARLNALTCHRCPTTARSSASMPLWDRIHAPLATAEKRDCFRLQPQN